MMKKFLFWLCTLVGTALIILSFIAFASKKESSYSHNEYYNEIATTKGISYLVSGISALLTGYIFYTLNSLDEDVKSIHRSVFSGNDIANKDIANLKKNDHNRTMELKQLKKELEELKQQYNTKFKDE